LKSAEDQSPKTFTNSIGIQLTLIPAGGFIMGSPGEDGEAFDDETPAHEVRITRPFYLGVHEVTQAQYAAAMGNNPSWFSANGGGHAAIAGHSSDRHPVESVLWLDAVKFCNHLSETEGLTAFYEVEDQTVHVPNWRAPGYRLPTEAEWEYACRANSETRYSFGDDAAGLGKHGWYDGNSDGRTHPVGLKSPNKFGLYDIHGNVWEWCWDCYGVRYYAESAADDPRGPSQGAARVFRGGAWDYRPQGARSAFRIRYSSEDRPFSVGFRVARNAIDNLTSSADR
jgi:formylglycine-generating enzyme required for sulfatase activity